MRTPRPCKRLPAEPSSDRQAGRREEAKYAGRRIPTMWEDAVCARAPPHETLQSTRKRKLEPSPQSTTPVYPRQSHEAPGMFPQVRTRHTPTAQRTRTDPTGQAFPQVTSPPNHTHHPQPHNEPTATPNRTSGTKRGKAYLSSRARDKERGTHASAKGVTRGGGHLPSTHGDTRASLQPRRHKARGERAFPTRGA